MANIRQLTCVNCGSRDIFSDNLCVRCFGERDILGVTPTLASIRLKETWKLSDSTHIHFRPFWGEDLEENWRGYRVTLWVCEPKNERQLWLYPWRLLQGSEEWGMWELAKSQQATSQPVTEQPTQKRGRNPNLKPRLLFLPTNEFPFMDITQIVPGPLVVLLIRIYQSKGSIGSVNAPFLEGRWKVNSDTLSWDLLNVNSHVSDAELSRWVSLLRNVKHRSSGRPFNTGHFQSREAFLIAVRAAIHRIQEHGLRVSKESVASMLDVGKQNGELGVDVTTLKRYLRRFHLSWRDDIHPFVPTPSSNSPARK